MIAGLITSSPEEVKLFSFKDMASTDGLAGVPYKHNAERCWQSNGQCMRFYQQSQSELAGSSTIYTHPETGTSIVAWARIDNKKEIADQLPAQLSAMCETHEGAILAAYLNWNNDCCKYLHGDYAFAIYDGRNDQVYCARDPLGVRPLYYKFENNVFVFATSVSVIADLSEHALRQDALDETPTVLDEHYVSDYLCGYLSRWDYTVYKNISKLPPAHYGVLGDCKWQATRYHEFDAMTSKGTRADEDYVGEYAVLLREAVNCRVKTGRIASESSGGLDSSTVTALASSLMQQPEKDLYAFGIDDDDLTAELVMLLSEKIELSATHYWSNAPGAMQKETLQRFFRSFGGPPDHSNGLAYYYLYDSAEKLGLDVLLSGFGGDEFVTNSAALALVEFWQAGEYGLFWSRQRGSWLTKPLHIARWLYHYYVRGNHSVTSQLLQSALQAQQSNSFLRQELIQRYKTYDYANSFMQYDGPYQRINDFLLGNRWSPMLTARFENCSLMAATYGIEYRWPLLDVRLMEYFLSVPAEEKLGPNLMGRYLHRRSVADLIPSRICWKSKDMQDISALGKLYRWLVRFFEQTPKEIPLKQPPSSARALSETNIKIHPWLHHFVDETKIMTRFQLIKSGQLDTQSKRHLIQQWQRLKRLNDWLFFRHPV